MGLLLPDQRLDHQLRVVLRRGAQREDHLGETQRRDSEIHHRVGRNDCGAADFRKDSRLVTITAVSATASGLRPQPSRCNEAPNGLPPKRRLVLGGLPKRPAPTRTLFQSIASNLSSRSMLVQAPRSEFQCGPVAAPELRRPPEPVLLL